MLCLAHDYTIGVFNKTIYESLASGQFGDLETTGSTSGTWQDGKPRSWPAVTSNLTPLKWNCAGAR